MSDVLDLETTLSILPDDTYILSYPHLLDFFAAKQEYSVSDVVCGAHMVYGWMPTILELGADIGGSDLIDAASLLTKAKCEGALSNSELERLAKVTNNSLVGASKLLHFIVPSSFAIWDSKIYAFVFRERPHNYRVQQTSRYRQYLESLVAYQNDARFPAFHAAVNKKIGYAVSGFRALELVMFQHSPTIGPFVVSCGMRQSHLTAAEANG